MIIRCSMSPRWLSNTYLVADRPGGRALLIDTGGPAEPILRMVDEMKVTVTHALCTHHHLDHVAHNDLYRRWLGCVVGGHPAERDLFGNLDVTLSDGMEILSGELRARCLHIPGHTAGQLAFVLNEERVFTGDTLFRGSVGGTRAPGHTCFADLRRSIMEVLMTLPPEMTVHPGHTDSTTIGREWELNPFIRMWRGLEPPGSATCAALGEPATLLLRAPDYDGGTKCWVRFDEGAREDIVPGSRVEDLPEGRDVHS
ncbi:MAG TPA: MBL fold metallo-hydrolase [Candidatus Polarisedimenticolia bacterium]|nr:MBL fold metallo-hydrolase [Candidatus Polarisedimenticolia bacterium]